MPVVYTVIFLTQDTRGALLRSIPLYALVLCVSVPRAFGLFAADATSFRIAFSLVQLYLSSAVIIATLFLFCLIKDWVSEAESLVGRMKRLSETDELTGLHNRRRAARVLEEGMERSRRYGVPLRMIVLDIDDFKSVNDELGHDVGNKVLREMARLGEHALRENDEFSRWSGEEFMVLAPETNRESAHRLAERLRSHIEEHDFGVRRRISASFGGSEFHPRDSRLTLVKRADVALYRAKLGGKNRVVVESSIA